MASRQFVLPEIGDVTVYKRRNSKHVRVSIDAHNHVRVSIPTWLPYSQGLTFARQKTSWIVEKRHKVDLLVDDMTIGKFHRLYLERSDTSRIVTRVSDSKIKVIIPKDLATDSIDVQQKIQKACIRALKIESEKLLPQRLLTLADRFGYKYSSITIKHLKSRWGSCTNKRDITLNCLLIQLTWAEIDYVILHELAHTLHMSHGKAFWVQLERTMPEYKAVKSTISKRKPVLFETR